MNYRAFLQWLLSHADLIPQLFKLATDVFSAPTLLDKWNSLKSIGNLLVPVLDDMPTEIVTTSEVTLTAMEEADLAAEIEELELAIVGELQHRGSACGKMTALAWDGSKLKKLFEVVQLVLPLLLSLKG